MRATVRSSRSSQIVGLQLLDKPATCPHGNPIPGLATKKPRMRALGQYEAGDEVRVARVTGGAVVVDVAGEREVVAGEQQ